MAADTPYKSADIILAGVPFDAACSFRPGAKFAPGKIREMSYVLEEYSIYQDRSLLDVSFCDVGNIGGLDDDIGKAHSAIAKAVSGYLKDNKLPVLIGGDHSISIPAVSEFFKIYGKSLVVVQLDAHADFRDGYLGSPCSHASVIRRIADFLPAGNIYQFGIRSGSREEINDARSATNFFSFSVLDNIHHIKDLPILTPIYITIDIDVLDPAFANGTGTPEPGGISASELVKALLALKGCNIVGMDIVEVSPPYDDSGRTAVTAAMIIREAVLLISK